MNKKECAAAILNLILLCVGSILSQPIPIIIASLNLETLIRKLK